MKILKSREIDFTRGNIYKEIACFSLPLLLGNLIMQFYFIADSIIVGRYLGSLSLASVGTVTTVTGLLIFFFQGIASGAGILVSQVLGSGEFYKIKKIISAASIFNIIFGMITFIVCYLFADKILELISVPKDIFPMSLAYMKMVFIALLPMLIYHIASAFLQALGDAKTPVYYLALASILNIILDLVFIQKFKMGVEGTALATTIALVIAAILIMIHTYVKVSRIGGSEGNEIEFVGSFREFRNIITKISKLGLPIGIQSTVISFSNVIVQNHINNLGSENIAAWSVFCRIDTLIIMPFMSFGIAVMTFVGQNYGAVKIDRIVKGVKAGKILSIGVTVFFSIILFLFPEFFYGYFVENQNVISIASSMTRFMVPGYVFIAVARIYVGAISGTGDSKSPLYVNFAFMCVYRVIAIPVLSNLIGSNLFVIFITYWTSWFFSWISIKIFYETVTKKRLFSMKV